MQLLFDQADACHRAETLLVWLPPAGARPEAFVEQGFVAALRAAALPVDCALAGVEDRWAMDRSATAVVHEQVIRPARAAGYRQVWLAGISLGAFNALHYAARHAACLAGMFLLAPYPGTRDILLEIRAAGGPQAWAASAPADMRDERIWWHWLVQQSHHDEWPVPVWYASGDADRFAAGQALLAELLPQQRVRHGPGGHEWAVWLRLWRETLAEGRLFQAAGRTQP